MGTSRENTFLTLRYSTHFLRPCTWQASQASPISNKRVGLDCTWLSSSACKKKRIKSHDALKISVQQESWLICLKKRWSYGIGFHITNVIFSNTCFVLCYWSCFILTQNSCDLNLPHQVWSVLPHHTPNNQYWEPFGHLAATWTRWRRSCKSKHRGILCRRRLFISTISLSPVSTNIHAHLQRLTFTVPTNTRPHLQRLTFTVPTNTRPHLQRLAFTVPTNTRQHLQRLTFTVPTNTRPHLQRLTFTVPTNTRPHLQRLTFTVPTNTRPHLQTEVDVYCAYKYTPAPTEVDAYRAYKHTPAPTDRGWRIPCLQTHMKLTVSPRDVFLGRILSTKALQTLFPSGTLWILHSLFAASVQRSFYPITYQFVKGQQSMMIHVWRLHSKSLKYTHTKS